MKKVMFTLLALFISFAPVNTLAADISLNTSKKSLETNSLELLLDEAKGYSDNKEIYDKITPWLKGNLEGLEEVFIDYAIEYEVDPVLAVAISLFETGNGSSDLCINNNNFGGMRVNGTWLKFDSREEGAKSYIRNLSRYTQKGLDTPSEMTDIYAEGSQHWVDNVEWFIDAINAEDQ